MITTKYTTNFQVKNVNDIKEIIMYLIHRIGIHVGILKKSNKGS